MAGACLAKFRPAFAKPACLSGEAFCAISPQKCAIGASVRLPPQSLEMVPPG
jgi:hypothetical protein